MKSHVLVRLGNGTVMTLCYFRGFQKKNTLNGLVTGKFFDTLPEENQCLHCKRVREADKAKKQKS